eukprot:2604335-Amphidinium_carterae.1
MARRASCSGGDDVCTLSYRICEARAFPGLWFWCQPGSSVSKCMLRRASRLKSICLVAQSEHNGRPTNSRSTPS